MNRQIYPNSLKSSKKCGKCFWGNFTIRYIKFKDEKVEKGCGGKIC